jgi:hypothetical protein
MRRKIWYVCSKRNNSVSGSMLMNQHNNMKITNLNNTYKMNQRSTIGTQNSVFHCTTEYTPAEKHAHALLLDLQRITELGTYQMH